MYKAITSVAIIFCVAGVASGYSTIAAGNHNLRPDSNGQTIQIMVYGDDVVDGMIINLMLGDGGTIVGGSPNAPQFISVDVLTGTIFSGVASGDLYPDTPGIGGGFTYPQLAYNGTTTNPYAPSTVVTSGVLATVTIDTAGIPDGDFTLSVTNSPNGSSEFYLSAYDPNTYDPNYDTPVTVLSTTLLDGNIHVMHLGDADDDGDVDIFDFMDLQASYGQTGKQWPDGDFDGDGDVDIFDFMDLQAEYNWTSGGGGGGVPEPMTIVLLAVGGLIGLSRRRKGRY